MITVDVFTLGYNEENILPHYIDHYKSFCRNITFYNNCSTDNSVDICLKNGVKVVNTDLNELNDVANINIKHSCYLNSDADFCIVTDTDELLYHPDIVKLLTYYKTTGVNLPKIRGYTMATNSGYPKVGNLIKDIKTGIPSINYAKRCIFDPKLKINWSVGQHILLGVKGSYKESEQEDLSLLHYKFIDREEIHKKKISYSKRMSNINKINGFGSGYNHYDKKQTDAWFDSHVKDSIQVI